MGAVLGAYATPLIGWRGLFAIGLLPAAIWLARDRRTARDEKAGPGFCEVLGTFRGMPRSLLKT